MHELTLRGAREQLQQRKRFDQERGTTRTRGHVLWRGTRRSVSAPPGTGYSASSAERAVHAHTTRPIRGCNQIVARTVVGDGVKAADETKGDWFTELSRRW